MGRSEIEIPVTDSWDEYFYNICLAAAGNSKCLSRKIGAILVRDKSVISTGYNGPPRGVPRCDGRWKIDDALKVEFGKFLVKNQSLELDEIMKELPGKCPRLFLGFKSGERLDLCVAGHAEENAILNAARMDICTKGSTMYMTCGIPCSKCLIKIINAGVEKLVVTSFDLYDATSKYLLESSQLGVRIFDFLEEKI